MIIFEPIYRGTEGQDIAVKLETGDDYIAWFPGQQSTGLWYYKRLIIDGDAHVVIPEDSIFYIYDPSTSGDFVDNKKALKKELDIPTENGYANIYIVGCANEPGEFIESITINDEPLRIGMEVYGENELLRINLQNMGVELPDNITTAIYETDLYEEKTDWVTLNNKWRELLINYMDVAGCKGNYKSLENSLEWFNYGRLVELRECWKHETEDGVKLMDRPLNRWLSDWYNKSLGDLAKSTFMIIRQCSVDLSKKTGTELPKNSYPDNEAWYVPVYQPYTYDPERIHEDDLTETEIKWAKDEMRMKMTLLGLFFETNFMPVHLDLLRCSVEDIILDTPYTVRMNGVPEIEYFCCDTLNEMIIHGYGKDKEPDEEGFDIVLHLDQQSVYGCDWIYKPNTPNYLINFGATRNDIGSNMSKIPDIIGVSLDPPLKEERSGYNPQDLAATMSTWYNEIGAVAEFEITTPTKITEGTIITNITGKVVTRKSDIICNEQEYNVDWQGNILNYSTVDETDENIITWQPGLKYYKQILRDQYAVVNQYGLPINDERYTEIKEEWGWEEWTEDIDYDPTQTYWAQTSTATYVIVNGLGQQIDDTRYKERPEGIEWKFDLTYKRLLYKTEVKLLCQHPGTFWALIELRGGYTYNHRFNIKVIDNLEISLEFFKLVWDFEDKDPFDIENLGPNKGMFTTTRDPDTDPDIWVKQGWPSRDNGKSYEIPAKIIDTYKYQQYLPLSTFAGMGSFNKLEDKPRLVWMANVSPLNGGASMEDPTPMLDSHALENFYVKKVTYNEDLDETEEEAPEILVYVQYISKIRYATKTELRELLSPLEGTYNVVYKREFIPEFHKMIHIDPAKAEIIPISYPIIAVPIIELDVNGKRRDLTWSHKLDEPAWEFYSYSNAGVVDHLKFNIQQPFIASQYKQYTPVGRYKVSFSYKWGDEVKTVTRMSPFNIIPE